ncbi:prolactin-like [Clupea harengus]|uniref:Prolactin-like n=1 Tax=Clupea harengus TaxID=7950 RepID=A0A6P8GH09_CLUHA|nr:prolactin-like [Clupea harengus]
MKFYVWCMSVSNVLMAVGKKLSFRRVVLYLENLYRLPEVPIDVEWTFSTQCPLMWSGAGSVFFMLVALGFLDLHARVCTAPICASGQVGCHVLSLSDLFDRVIQHSARVHGLSSHLHSDFEQYSLPSRNHIGRVFPRCHTSNILTPNGKENAQKLAREELTEVILKLLMAWKEPLGQLHQSMAQEQDVFNSVNSNKALDMSNMVHELRKGVKKVVEKMQHLGMISNSVSGVATPDSFLPSADSGQPQAQARAQPQAQPQARTRDNHMLLFCFRRDSNKVQNYLKILKCRIVPEHGC